MLDASNSPFGLTKNCIISKHKFNIKSHIPLYVLGYSGFEKFNKLAIISYLHYVNPFLRCLN